jgi:hypothetical protein
MNSVDHLRYIFHNLDSDLVADIENSTPGGLKMLCQLYTLQLQLEKERYKTSSKDVIEYLA